MKAQTTLVSTGKKQNGQMTKDKKKRYEELMIKDRKKKWAEKIRKQDEEEKQ